MEKHCYQFKSFRLDVEERQLLRHNKPVPLTPKAFDVLVTLVERSGHLVEKDELMALIWADSFVEEHNIARIVHTLRKTLDEDESGEKFIETVAKKGYRFVAEVEEVSAPSARQEKTSNGKSSFAAENPTPLNFAATTNDTEVAIASPSIEKKSAPPLFFSKPGRRAILFGVGFLTAFFLLFLLSFYLKTKPGINPNKGKSIAVLPVKPIGTANRDEIYEIGIADSLIQKLGASKNFIVRPLDVTRKYSDIGQDPLAAGREQKTDYVLASNYQLAGGRIRITAQLFNVATGQIEETFKSEREAGDVFAVQDSAAKDIGNRLLARFSLTPGNQPARRGTNNEEAYRLYLQGKNWRATAVGANAKKAVEYFEQAIRLDPNYALAFAGIGDAFMMSGNLGGGLPREEFEKARAAINRALELDPNLAEAYAVRAALKFRYEWDFAGSEEDSRRANELDPDHIQPFDRPATHLTYLGRFDEAMANIEAALEADPTSLSLQNQRGRTLYFARRWDEAIVQFKQVAEVDETSADNAFLMLIYEMKGDDAQAYEWFMKQKRVNTERRELYQKAYETGGWKEVRQKLLEFEKAEELTPSGNACRVARQAALLGEKETAFEYLYKALEKRHSQMIMLKVEPAFDNIRDDPRFDELIRRVGFN